MPNWIETATNIVVGALVLALVVKYRDTGILRRISESKRQFRTWLKSALH